jgi:mRNA-degrading endonuclease toxin of MazEF toxin-antitoxin module
MRLEVKYHPKALFVVVQRPEVSWYRNVLSVPLVTPDSKALAVLANPHEGTLPTGRCSVKLGEQSWIACCDLLRPMPRNILTETVATLDAEDSTAILSEVIALLNINLGG